MSVLEIPSARDTVAEIDALIGRLDDRDHLHMLETARDHYWGEVVWDIDAVIATLSPTEPITYRFHGGAFMGSEGTTVSTLAEARALYEGARDSGVVVGAMTDMHWGFGPEGMSLETRQFVALPGRLMPNYSERLDEDQLYLVNWHGASFFPFDAKLRYMLGEWVYSADTPYAVTPIDASAVERMKA